MLEYILTSLNTSRVFSVLMIFIMNIGSKYIAKDIPIAVDLIFENFWARMIVIFCIAFISTHDFFVSLCTTLLFIVLFSYILNEESYSCLLKKTINNYKQKNITEQDVANAYKVINDYRLQTELKERKNHNINMTNPTDDHNLYI